MNNYYEIQLSFFIQLYKTYMYLVYIKNTTTHFLLLLLYFLLFHFYSVVLNRMCAGYHIKNKTVVINLMSVDLPVAFSHAKVLEWFHY